MYEPAAWFWIVGGDTSRAWSSAAGAYVASWDAARVTRIASASDLSDVLGYYGLPGPIVRASDVQTERARRLALGFDYDFGGARGVHRIRTTPADMIGWDEVTKIASALIATGAGSAELSIVTDTGPVAVTALEWQDVLIAAAAFRQPIWAGSFVLQAMPTIPTDYASNNSYWT